MIEFFMAMIPPTVTSQEKKIHVINGKPVTYEPAELKAARRKLTAYLGPHVPASKIMSSVELVTKWCFPRGAHADGEYRATKPDTDNLQKLLKDCMTDAGYWKDDALVVREVVEKFWAEIPGIYIRITELEGFVMVRYLDKELLDMWLNKNKSREELVKMLQKENKGVKAADARNRIDRILCRWSFENQGLPVPEMWK